MTDFKKTTRNRVKRIPKRGKYSKKIIYPIIDAAPICHVGYVDDEQPYVIPTIHARSGDTIYIHGAKASRTLKKSASGVPMCITVTLIDGIVVARSLFHHSMNYRSVVIFGHGRLVKELDEKMQALTVITEHLIPGRWSEARKPNKKELNATSVVAVSIESASAKIRSGHPIDDDEDYTLPIWAGIVPVKNQILPPQPDPLLRKRIEIPESLQFLTSKVWKK